MSPLKLGGICTTPGSHNFSHCHSNFCSTAFGEDLKHSLNTILFSIFYLNNTALRTTCERQFSKVMITVVATFSTGQLTIGWSRFMRQLNAWWVLSYWRVAGHAVPVTESSHLCVGYTLYHFPIMTACVCTFSTGWLAYWVGKFFHLSGEEEEGGRKLEYPGEKTSDALPCKQMLHTESVLTWDLNPEPLNAVVTNECLNHYTTGRPRLLFHTVPLCFNVCKYTYIYVVNSSIQKKIII